MIPKRQRILARIGQAVGPYQIESLLGEGGVGVVYLASHAELGSRVAIKIIERAGHMAPRIRREARIMANLNHPGIARASDLGALPDGAMYVVMEYLQGRSLADQLRDQGPPPLAVTLRLAIDIAIALAVAHGQGIVHRDIKPGNVYLAVPQGGGGPAQVKLLDFGLARLTDPGRSQLTTEPAVMGTPYYMAPEQWRTTKVGYPADAYSFGVVLYEMIVGRPPFSGPWMEVCDAHLSKAPTPPSQVPGKTCPPDLEALILELLAKDPAKRPTLADAIGRLRALAGGEPGEAVPKPAQQTASGTVVDDPLVGRSVK